MYADGFRNMRTGRRLWLLIAVKLAILFGVLKLFFFPDLLKEAYDSDSERAEAVRSHLCPDSGQEDDPSPAFSRPGEH